MHADCAAPDRGQLAGQVPALPKVLAQCQGMPEEHEQLRLQDADRRTGRTGSPHLPYLTVLARQPLAFKLGVTLLEIRAPEERQLCQMLRARRLAPARSVVRNIGAGMVEQQL